MQSAKKIATDAPRVPLKVTGETFESIVLESEHPVLVDFWAPWCAPCRMMEPALAEIADEFAGQAIVAKVNIDEEQALAQAARIRAVPTMLLFQRGEVVDVLVGGQQPMALRRKLNKLLAKG